MNTHKNDNNKLVYTFTREMAESYLGHKLEDDQWSEFCLKAFDQLDDTIDDLVDNILK
jgi:hypothetical protein